MSVTHAKRRTVQTRHNRRRVVTVIGSGRTADPRCADVGRLVAALGCDLLTGGGRGVMEAVSRAFFETAPRRGLVIGVLPGAVDPLTALEDRQSGAVGYELPDGYPNPWVELAIFTHLPDSGEDGTLRSSRNHINILTADAVVALPGREGTSAEMWLALQYGVPIVAFGEHHESVPRGLRRAASLEELRDFLIDQLGD